VRRQDIEKLMKESTERLRAYLNKPKPAIIVTSKDLHNWVNEAWIIFRERDDEQFEIKHILHQLIREHCEAGAEVEE